MVHLSWLEAGGLKMMITQPSNTQQTSLMSDIKQSKRQKPMKNLMVGCFKGDVVNSLANTY